ncbi:MAG: lysophospholipase [Chloroflexota bacterium]
MKHISSSFTTVDNLRIHTETWLPADDPRAVIVISHGAAEHIGRYAHVAARFVAEGYAVYGYDHRGHGQSDGKRGYFDNFARPVQDFARFLRLIQTTQNSKKMFVFGHSMGALIVLDYLLMDDVLPLAGVMVTGVPLAMDDTVPNFVVSAVRTLNHVLPDAPLLSLDVTGMSRDPAVLATWTTDPHVNLTMLRVRTTLGILGTVRHIRANLTDITLPMLIMHGEGDRIVDASGSVALYNGISSADKQLHLYPELYHELVNEPERDMVLADMVNWLDDHRGTGT